MRWKLVASAVCAAPLVGGSGCNIAYYATKNILNEPVELADNLARTRDLRTDARRAWKEVRGQYPRHLFTAEFYDGFVEGYSDYLDRGGDAVPPAVPPKRLTRNNYLTPDGQALIQDYYLGFQYGVDVAVATGKRNYLVVPVQVGTKPSGPPAFNILPPGDPACAQNGNCGTPAGPVAPGSPAPVPVPVPAVPMPAPGVAPPAAGARIGPVPGAPTLPTIPAPAVSADHPRTPPRPVAATPAPAPGAAATPKPAPVAVTPPKPAAPRAAAAPRRADDLPGSKFGPAPASREEPVFADPADAIPPTSLPVSVTVPDGPSPTGVELRLPAPPARVRTLPAGAPTPPVHDDLPVVPPNHTIPAPKPPTHDLPPAGG